MAEAAQAQTTAILVEAVYKSFGRVQALKDVNLEVPYGTVMALVGPNGAGKTTLVRILTTLLKPDAGRAQVVGYDVAHDAAALRTVIGLAGQYAAVDQNLTGRENLRLVGHLYHLARAEVHNRTDELLQRFNLTDAAGRTAKTYSGGMRRRLDLAASLMSRPRILFLDEPTSGLDPRSRMELWEVIKGLVKEGMTVLLTTQYMEEADQLANSITVIDRGSVIAKGTAAELKASSGGVKLHLLVADRTHISSAADILAKFGADVPHATQETGQITVSVNSGASVVADVVRQLDAAGIEISDIGLRQPTLDDVFLALTGHTAEDTLTQSMASRGRRWSRSRKGDMS